MQMVSAAKLGKSEQAAKDLLGLCPCKVRKLLTDLLHGHETENTKSHPCWWKSAGKKRQLIS